MTKPGKTCAIVLAGGSGSRMQARTKKQFMEVDGVPLLWYSLQVFQSCLVVDEVILVASEEDLDHCRLDIVAHYGFSKVKQVVEGGKERYHSVFAGLSAVTPDTSYVLIHDSARPFVTEEIIRRSLEDVQKYGASIVAMPVKDTIKICDKEQMVTQTPDRTHTWLMQTPQVFSYSLVKKAYEKLMESEKTLIQKGIHITDDAMVVETFFPAQKIHLVEGSYENFKVTTPEDLLFAQVYGKRRQ